MASNTRTKQSDAKARQEFSSRVHGALPPGLPVSPHLNGPFHRQLFYNGAVTRLRRKPAAEDPQGGRANLRDQGAPLHAMSPLFVSTRLHG